jgi:predicted DNA-binding transcriptional regulator AlpA
MSSLVRRCAELVLNRGFPMNPNEYVDVKGLAAITGISVSTWNKRRLTGDTPPFSKIGRSVGYHVPTVKTWMDERLRCSTSDHSASVAA